MSSFYSIALSFLLPESVAYFNVTSISSTAFTIEYRSFGAESNELRHTKAESRRLSAPQITCTVSRFVLWVVLPVEVAQTHQDSLPYAATMRPVSFTRQQAYTA